ncbi:hypothetical protein PCANC_26873 [Puccinia coronata f. sp. avenae]|uniref:Uncharacterized protein n=1 Tax=Puccinia coronata f. sp. avenae TaxID=200324 RepID=A0A2N5TLT8_9BASI|nr:hypothetical protein PCANC_26873 [Puccinia coronata f. sp. avenae]
MIDLVASTTLRLVIDNNKDIFIGVRLLIVIGVQPSPGHCKAGSQISTGGSALPSCLIPWNWWEADGGAGPQAPDGLPAETRTNGCAWRAGLRLENPLKSKPKPGPSLLVNGPPVGRPAL